MRLYNIDEKTNIVSNNLSEKAVDMLNIILNISNDILNDIDLYHITKKSRKEIALSFRELRKKKYIIYSSLDDTYYVYASPQNV